MTKHAHDGGVRVREDLHVTEQHFVGTGMLGEYLRRALARERRVAGPVTIADLELFSSTFRDLADPDVMDQAWQ